MFCDKCGSAVQADQRFCGTCGRELTGGAGVGFPRRSRVHEHIRLLGILWLAFAAFNALGAVILYVLANTLFRHMAEFGGPANAGTWLHPFIGVIALIVAAKAALGFVTGWGLLQREPWARMLTIVLAFLALFHVPFGTALGVYTLWVLLPAESDAEYHSQARGIHAA
ncbi:MAG: zinc-ribbon domain-containing protein [Terriglobales bacterium]